MQKAGGIEEGLQLQALTTRSDGVSSLFMLVRYEVGNEAAFFVSTCSRHDLRGAHMVVHT